MEGLGLQWDLSSENGGKPVDKTLKFEEDNKVVLATEETTNELTLQNDEEENVEQDVKSFDILENKNSNIKELVKSVLGSSVLEIEDEEGNLEEKNIDDVDMTEAEWGDLIKEHYSEKINTLKEGSVQLGGLDEVRRAMISAIKSGNDPSEVLHFQEHYVDPMANIDISHEEGQIEILSLRYKDAIESGDMSKSDVETLIEVAKSKGELEEKAEVAFEQIKNALKKKALDIQAKAEEEEKERENFYKDYEKDFKNIAKEVLGVSGSYAKELVDFILKPDENEPRLTKFNAKVMGLLKQPKKAVDLALYVYDSEKFNKKVSTMLKSDVLEEQKKKVRVVKKYKHNKGLPTETDNKNSSNKVLFSTNING